MIIACNKSPKILGITINILNMELFIYGAFYIVNYGTF